MFKASQEQIKDLLFVDGAVLKIPKYQRSYTWSKDEVDDFWDDIVVSDTSFIGTFILNTQSLVSSRVLEVIDGQQRLITITVFLAVLRDVAVALGHKALADRVHKKTIVSEDFKGVVTNRIEVGESLKPFFSNFIQSGTERTGNKSTTKEEKLVLDNYEYLSEKVNDLVKESANANLESVLQELLEKLSSIDCVVIRVSSDEDAYSIFETVNARGVDLSVADLLKNHIFKQFEIEGNLQSGQTQWDILSQNILDTEVDLQKFLRYFWLSKYNFVTERELFKDIKKAGISVSKLMEEMVLSSELYLKISSNNADDWSGYQDSNAIAETLAAIDIMGASQCHVLFISILRNANDLGGNLKRIFKTVENFTFLYSAVSKLPTNKIEKIYSKYAIKIDKECALPDSKNKIKNLQRTVDSLIKDLEDLKPPASLFVERFMEIQYKNSTKNRKLITYILSSYNYHLHGKELIINFDAVNIEHLIPQNPSKDWKVTKRDIKNHVNLLGNLVLVLKEYNAKAGNKSLKDKCLILDKTKITSTKELISSIIENDYVWNEESILKRQNDLATASYKLWDY